MSYRDPDGFASLTLAALLALAATAQRRCRADRNPQTNEAKSQAELERKLADARKRLDEAAREVANLSMSMSDDVVPHMRGVRHDDGWTAARGAGHQSRARDDDVPGDGVEVVSVSPGGAAERAGLKAGDVLTEINGKALKRDDDDVGARASCWPRCAR